MELTPVPHPSSPLRRLGLRVGLALIASSGLALLLLLVLVPGALSGATGL